MLHSRLKGISYRPQPNVPVTWPLPRNQVKHRFSRIQSRDDNDGNLKSFNCHFPTAIRSSSDHKP